MEQNEINIEKQELMERIKEEYEKGIWPKNKWLKIAQTIFLAFLPFWVFCEKITDGEFGLVQSIYLAFCILYAIILMAADYMTISWNKRIQQAETAQDLLEATDRYARVSTVGIGVLLAVVATFALSLLIINHEMMWTVIVLVLAVVLIALFILINPRQGKDIKRLRELVELEDKKSEASV